ncbi:MAG: hormogonium polysaccharide biosynthesis protein HpsA [Cyanobacteria bacterium P01_H01_bin.15]
MSSLLEVKNLILRLGNRLARSFISLLNTLLSLIPRLFRSISKREKLSKSGFVLPIAAVVVLASTLLIGTLLTRSSFRAQNVADYRVTQATLDASAPGVERARAKLDALFNDSRLPFNIPSDQALLGLLADDRYSLDDEDRLLVRFDIDSSNSIESSLNTTPTQNLPLNQDEATNSAWRFPIDTNNNGLYDSFVLYTLALRNPPVQQGQFARERVPIDARALPQAQNELQETCNASLNTSAALVNNEGWFQQANGEFAKSFFVYVATIPITDVSAAVASSSSGNIAIVRNTSVTTNDFEVYPSGGNPVFAGLELQQDRAKLPLNVNAIAYDNDLEMSVGPAFEINGRIFTNGNLLISELDGIFLRQVSSVFSCYYNIDYSKVLVGGNFNFGASFYTRSAGGRGISVDQYNGVGQPVVTTRPTLDESDITVDAVPSETAYNGQAFELRLNSLADSAFTSAGLSGLNFNGFNLTGTGVGNLPTEVVRSVEAKLKRPSPPPLNDDLILASLEDYFRVRTRRVPYAEVPYRPNGLYTNAEVVDNAVGSGDLLQPPNKWMYPYDPSDGVSESGYSELPLRKNGSSKLFLPASAFEEVASAGIEQNVGDRILVGNGLPLFWIDPNTQEYVTGDSEQLINGISWDSGTGTRSRRTQMTPLVDVGDIDRDGFWESNAAFRDPIEDERRGGLTIVTGAGIYLPWDGQTTVPTAAASETIVWPDSFPQPSSNPAHPNYSDRPGGTQSLVWDTLSTANPPPQLGGPLTAVTPVSPDLSPRPYLQARGTVVYHYLYDTSSSDGNSDGKPDPIACINTFYDPTNAVTANGFDRLGTVINSGGSVNGTVLPPPNLAETGNVGAYLAYLAAQNYPNGRKVNPLLAEALAAPNRSARTLAQRSAVEAALCGLQTLGLVGTGTAPAGYTIPQFAIRETAFLDSREIKNLDNYYLESPVGARTTRGSDNLPLEYYQPLEIRATAIDINALRTTTAGPTSGVREYMIPNSGIIYASRNDSLPDASDIVDVSGEPAPYDVYDDTNNTIVSDTELSATDYILDPTRRPNGFLLTNGERLYREAAFRQEEKGFIFVSNDPVYLRGDFNLHQNSSGLVGEFNSPLTASNYNTLGQNDSDFNQNFACRNGDPRLPSAACSSIANSDEWRPASVLADALTLLSSSFREGFRDEGNYELNFFRIDQLADPDPDVNPGIDLEDRFTAWNGYLQRGIWGNYFALNGLSSGAITDEVPGTTIAQPTVVPPPFVPSTSTTPTANLRNFTNATDESYRGDPRPGGSGSNPYASLFTRSGGYVGSTYFNNFATPVQRRQTFDHYIMEYCPKVTVTACDDGDWFVDHIAGTKASSLIGQSLSSASASLLGGTTANAPNAAAARYPRRVAFLRDLTSSSELVLINGSGVSENFGSAAAPTISNSRSTNVNGFKPQAIGIDSAGDIVAFDPWNYATDNPEDVANALWFATLYENRGTLQRSWAADQPLDYDVRAFSLVPLSGKQLIHC